LAAEQFSDSAMKKTNPALRTAATPAARASTFLAPARVGLSLWAGAVAFGADGPTPTPVDVSALIRAGLPAYVPKPTPTPGKATAPAAPADRDPATDPSVVRMSPYVTRERRLPPDESFLTKTGRADYAMDRYMGSATGLNRGVLNRYTLPNLWKKIPVLGSLPFVGPPGTKTNEDRSMDQLLPDELAESTAELASLNSFQEPAPAPAAKK